MKIAFTICSNNYLGSAKVLVDSFKRFHPDFEFIIALVDTLSDEVDYPALGCTVLPITAVAMPDVLELSQKFNIIELSTTVKPYYFKHFFFTLGANQAIYLDPDIEVFAPLKAVQQGLDSAMITLTPHMLTPVDDEFWPNDKHILPTGVFNLGFVALARHPQLAFFLDWWADRCLKYGFRNACEGLFYDQVWMNYVPTFFSSYHIIRDPGYNVANWNLHERMLTRDATGKWWVNQQAELAFFHFSHYDIKAPDIISSYHNRFTFASRPDILPLFTEYRRQVISHRGEFLKTLVPYYGELHRQAQKPNYRSYSDLKRRALRRLRALLD
jgi:hypothetical protein